MAREMLINVSEGEECRIALLEDGQLEELYMERTSSTSHVGNIYKGRVTNVEPSIQAAFVDFGLGRNGFLHISDLMPTYFGRKGEDIQESVGRKLARRDRPPIQRCLRRGDEIVVQIIKEGIGTKGPTLTTYLSIPGRILVMMPGMGKMGVSRKIEDETERRRLRQILDGLKPPKDVGFIIRTAGIGKTKAEIERDLKYLTRLWESIEKKRIEGPTPAELYTEGDLVTRTVRDVFTSEIDRIIIDNKDVAKRVKEFIKITAPRTRNKVELYDEPIPLFHKYGIEKDIEMMYSRHVPLPSGGSLVIDSTEAIVAIDVNSGKFREHADAETTAFKTDMEAADEIPRQLRLRDLGGVIICDFIDLRYERHRRELEKRLHENLRKDRAKTKMLRMSQFGIIEMTRQRMRPSLKRSIYFDCPYCRGAGLVKTPESMSLDVMRRLTIAAHDQRVNRIELAVCPDVGMFLLNKKRAALAALEAEVKKKIIVRQEAQLALDEMKLELYDVRDGRVYLDELGMTPEESDEHGRHRHDQRGRRDDRRDRGRHGRRPHGRAGGDGGRQRRGGRSPRGRRG
jgi:ribonuclease E